MEGEIQGKKRGSSSGNQRKVRLPSFHQLNAAAADGVPSPGSIHHLFERQVAHTPLALAVNDGVQTLTYFQLNASANRLGRHLASLGVGPERLVAICLDRTADMLVGILGVLKAGGAYVPLAPTNPVERLAYVLSDSEPDVVLTSGAHKSNFLGTRAHVVLLDDDWNEIEQYPADNSTSFQAEIAQSLAYVIYTSGSTGKPKGVMVEHRNVLNHWRAIEELYRAPFDCRRIGVNAPFTFDASVQQYTQLLSGCTLFLIPQSMRLDARSLVNYLEANRIEGVDCTPSQLSTWVSAGLLELQSGAPRTVLVGGEAIARGLWNRLAKCSHIAFCNVYGPTECTVDSTAARLSAGDAEPHIGRPLSGTQIHIWDEQRRPVPIGEKGEIYVGGAGVARGYLRRPELNESRFLFDQSGGAAGRRIYRTGDFGRWRVDGNIEFLGRNDDQVKIRGFRIELGEIEAQLAKDQSIKEVIVAAREDVPGDRRLVAYVTERVAGGVDVERLRGRLRSVLPQYMIPTAFVVLKGFEMTANGKLDRRSLPAPSFGACSSRPFIAPKGEVEMQVAQIWSELLGLPRVGRDDDFFELGGDSILAMKLLLGLDKCLAIQFPFPAIYQHSTLREMASAAEAIRSQDPSQVAESSAISTCSGPRPLTFQQEWIWSWLETNSSNCLMPFALKIDGSLNLAILRESLQALEMRHDSLRLRVTNRNGVRDQIVAGSHPIKAGVVELDGASEADIEEQAQVYLGKFFNQRLDLAAEPPFAVTLLKLNQEQFVLAIVFHHIIADATSVNVFFRELWQFYDWMLTGRRIPIQTSALQYADYAAWQHHQYCLQPQVIDSYWRTKFSPHLRLVPLSDRDSDEPRGAIAFMSFAFGKDVSVALHALAKQEKSSTAMVALALYAVRMSSWLEQNEVMVPFIVAGRVRSSQSEAIGLFSYPLFLRVVTDDVVTFRELIQAVSKEFRVAYEHLDFGKFASERRDLFICPTVQWLSSPPDGPSAIVRPHHCSAGADFAIRPYPVRPWWQDTLRVETAIGMQFWDAPDGICGQGYYRADLFSAAAMDRFANGIRSCGERVAHQPQTKLASLRGVDSA